MKTSVASRASAAILLASMVAAADCAAAGTSTVTRVCNSAIFSAPVKQGQSPRRVNAIVVSQAIFNDLKGARWSLDHPRALVPFYSYKSPLTVWGEGAVTVEIRRPVSGARLLYGQADLQKLGVHPVRLSGLPTRAVFNLCEAKNHARLATQYNGGFAVSRPMCVTIAVSAPGRKTVISQIPFGVSHCTG